MAVEFSKYRQRGAYHWREVSRHPLRGWSYTRSRVAWVVRACGASRRVLEIGCGDAAILGQLARQGKTVTGVDSDATALELARGIFSAQGLTGAFHAELSAVAGQRFDTVVLAEVLEHVDEPDALLATIAGLLEPGGRLVLTTPIRLLERPLDVHHVHEFWPEELRSLLARHFAEARVEKLHPAWFVDLCALGFLGFQPFSVLANLVKLVTGIELIDRVPSPLGLYWTQGWVVVKPQ